MKLKAVKMEDKLIRASPETWQMLRTAAFHQNTRIKTILDDIMTGKIDPTELKLN
jgi:hypothetical protein